MKQLLHRLDTGEVFLEELPTPAVGSVQILVESRASLISAGTERMLLEFGRSGMLDKARGQPDKVRQVLAKARTDGIGPTIEAVRAKLGAPIPMGYCQAGIVTDVGTRAGDFSPGERVMTNGPHAELVRVPRLLAARIPDGVSFEAAAFTPVASIALQGIRLAYPTLGETVVVYGLGLIGLLAVQLLRANGCRVIGIDRDAGRLALARQFGADTIDGTDGAVAEQVVAATGGIGADAVVLTLASKADEPIGQAAEMARKKGRLILVGVTGLRLTRDLFYKKELSFAVSCSYGPGRYDPAYEEKAQDYPLPYVRWTEQRNFSAVLDLMASKHLDPLSLITHRFEFGAAADAYDVIAGAEPSLGVILTYPGLERGEKTAASRTVVRPAVDAAAAPGCRVGVLGAGNFAVRTLIPALRTAGATLHTIASSGGPAATLAAKDFGFGRVTTDADVLFDDPDIDAVVVLTRHDTHASLALRALRAGKHVFVEKPLALTEAELDELEAAVSESGRTVMVGFNRRFAPLTSEVQELLRGRAGPVSIIATMNAGAIPGDHWAQDPEVGGGRIVGEACHLIDLARALVGAAITEVKTTAAHDAAGQPIDDIAHLSIGFADGSTAVVHYLANGSRWFPKERIECFFDGKVVAIDNWRRLRRFGVRGPLLERPRKMNKGHLDEMQRWVEAVRDGGPSPIPAIEVFEVSRWAVRAAADARARR